MSRIGESDEPAATAAVNEQSPPTQPLSVVVISQFYPPVLGGSEIEVQRVCAALIARGHRVLVLCGGGAPMPKKKHWVDPYGVPVRIIGGRAPAGLRDHEFAIGVAWELSKYGRTFDVAYFLMQGLHLITGIPAAKLQRLPFVMKFSGSSIISAMTNSRAGRLELSWLKRWAKRVMILNEGMQIEATKAGFEHRQLLWMPNPVDVQEFAPCPATQRHSLRYELGIPPTAKVIVFVGRLAPEKELQSLIGAFAAVSNEIDDALLVVVGEGPDRAVLQSCAQELGLNDSQVRFIGRVPIDGVRKWLQISDVFALVSSNEGFPCSLIEAMAVGLPSVVSDIPATVQLVTSGVHGVVTRLRSEQDLAIALASLLNDESERLRMGTAARDHVVRNYSTNEVVRRYEELFTRARAGENAERG
jgi:glycosyltransferase involved in cell wall biosynthesis